MMPHNKIYRTLIILTLIINLACDDFLEKNPLDQLSNETFWQSEEEVQMALVGCYSRLTDEQFFGYKRVDLDALTDNVQHKYNDDANGFILNISRGEIETTTGGIISDIWSSAYKGITTCNNFMDNIDNAPVSEEDKHICKGEASFLRAFFYFELIHFFGDVILYKTTPANVSEARIAQSPKNEVLEFIYSDLDYAISVLPNEPYSEGHAVKGSAMALKSRILLYEEKWGEVVELTNSIIESGIFELADSYEEIFIAPQDDSKEIMFSARYLNPDDYSDMDIELMLWGTLQPRQELVDEYECTDGKSISESTLYDPENPYENRDPRLGMSIMVPGEVWYNPDSTEHMPDPSQTGYFQKKYVDKNLLPLSTTTRSEQDFVHIRFADVLLMYAEAKNELSGPDASVYEAINSIRGRKGVDMPPLPTGLSQEELRTSIRKERRIELALEGLRYFDLKRWKIAHEVMPLVNDVGGKDIVFENPKHYLWPYQQTELERNPNLVPNPDYSY